MQIGHVLRQNTAEATCYCELVFITDKVMVKLCNMYMSLQVNRLYLSLKVNRRFFLRARRLQIFERCLICNSTRVKTYRVCVTCRCGLRTFAIGA